MGGGAFTVSPAETGSLPAAARIRRGAAFGLQISGDFPAPGLWTAAGTATMRRTSLRIVSRTTLARSWSGLEAERLLSVSAGRGGQALVVDAHPARGYMVRAEGFGAYLITADGRGVRVAPESADGWRWQRLLTAQVLPISALVQGLDLLHASAVQLNRRVLAFVGASSAGKTTLAAQLVLAGATLVCDDVLALEPGDHGVITHPGPALINLRESSSRFFDARARGRLGIELGRDEGAARLWVRRKAAPSPLHAIYLLRRGTTRRSGVSVKRLCPPATSELLGAAFGTAITARGRLIRHLDLCAHLARSVPVFALEAPAEASPRALARAILRQARTVS